MPKHAPRFENYKDKYNNITLCRDEQGVLIVQFHTDGDSLVWSAEAHEELAYCFSDISADRENRLVVLTGTGEHFCAEINSASFQLANPEDWDHISYEGRRLLLNLLDIEVPVISAINGPCRVHPEIPAMSDIVIASTSAVFQDAPHFMSGIVPGDGAHIVWPHLLGPNRGRYFLITGQEITAEQALDWGVVSEVVEPEKLMERAFQLAQFVVEKTALTSRNTRLVLTQRYKRIMNEGLGYGLNLEALAAMDMMSKLSR